jgi:argininosuccinate lyase
MKLWDKGYQLDQIIETFMTGDDPLLDQTLIFYDSIGSMAHAKMLHKIGILTSEESDLLVKGLLEIIQLAEKGGFKIQFEDEDVHTAIENALTQKLGELGKKLHTARSRNDQVLLDLRLYAKDSIIKVIQDLDSFCQLMSPFAKRHQKVAIPGRTHFQRAMPSSIGLWAGAFAESILDNIELLKYTYKWIDQCPLGSAASYGVSLPIDRQYTSDLLGFEKVQNNVLYANNSRGKFESVILHALVQVMNDLGKMATDIIIFSAPEFGYLGLPEKFCPGSSLMPQKRNPCPLELVRAKSAVLQGFLIQVLEIIRALPSGYNRDFQETKRPLIEGFNVTRLTIRAFTQLFAEIEVYPERCLESFTPELFATDQVLDLVKEGIPFRDAYRKVASRLNDLNGCDPVANILSKTHQGATGNLGLERIDSQIQENQNWVKQQNHKWQSCLEHLMT